MNKATQTSEEIAALLRRLRTERGFSGTMLARHASVSRRTLTRWERGENLPSLPELSAVLTALGATPDETRQAVASVAAPRAQKHARRDAGVVIGGETVPSPVGGDLLRALRLRCGRTQQEIAPRLGVTQATLARWESGAAWPAPTHLHSLCWELRASPEEVRALTVGRFSPATFLEYDGDRRSRPAPRSLTELRERLGYLQAHQPWDALSDLHTLAYIAGMAALGAGRDPRLRPAFAEAYGDRARLLMDAGRLAEAEEPARVALELVRPDGVIPANVRAYVTASIALAERDVYGNGLSLDDRRARTFDTRDAGRQGRYRWGMGRLSECLDSNAVSWEYRTWVMAHLARYAFGAGNGDAAVGWAERAYDVIEKDNIAGDQDRWARFELRTRLLVYTGRYADAVRLALPCELIIPLVPSSPSVVSATLLRTEALARLGNREARSRWDATAPATLDRQGTPVPAANSPA